jgi:FGGY-family pentulose kinase
MTGSTDKAAYFLGIDVGTGSARAGIFDQHGKLVGTDKCAIELYRDAPNVVEQSSSEIWNAVSAATKGALKAAGLTGDKIAGVGFDATCSLVVIGENGAPLPVGHTNDPNRNIIVWMDHRAIDQANRINATGHRVLDYVGGRISPEMETPKLLWLKENSPEVYNAAWQFMDLTDFLTWQATGDLSRSVCTVTCKWTFLAHENAWDASYFEKVGLNDLIADDFSKIGTKVVPAGTALGAGLTAEAAEDLGLVAGTPVAAGLIDAHAGGVGSVGAEGGGGAEANLAYVFGTSSCTMTSTEKPVFVPGVWGPYYSAMIPGLWLNEGGQSAAGAAIDALLALHPYSEKAKASATQASMSLPEWLAIEAEGRLSNWSNAVDLAKGVQVVPEFLGNRAPFADPHTRAVISGLSMDQGLESLLSLYIAGLCGIGYGLRQIIEAQSTAGAPIQRIVISGGAGRSPLIRQLLADATGVEVAAPASEEPVLLGAAILGVVASKTFPNIPAAMVQMTQFSDRFMPTAGAVTETHDIRFEIFKSLQDIARRGIHA